MSNDTEQSTPKTLSLFWFVAFLAATTVIFRYSSAWWMQALGYLTGFLAFGALLEFLKSRRG